MRARFSAYVVEDVDFLLATWHPDTQPGSISFGTDIAWETLDVLETEGGALDATGTVEFRARFRRNGVPLELHELSTFERVGGKWVYRDGFDPDQT